MTLGYGYHPMMSLEILPDCRGPATVERDRAVAVARRVLATPSPVESDVTLLARQFLRAVGLSEKS
jgi:hypothetical protein